MSTFTQYTIRTTMMDKRIITRGSKIIDAEYKFRRFIGQPIDELLAWAKRNNWKWKSEPLK